jgi:glyoxylase-like metal-dependent hydrolase (beta-lactamase superfamily II)
MTPFLIELPQRIPGWEHFVGSWVIQGGPTIVVDVGPGYSADSLIAQLHQKGISRVDYVWLTHIHIDHAGGLSPFLKAFPMAKAVVPGKGLAHLADPTKLWEGSLATLKEKAVAYGPIDPSPTEQLIPHQTFSLEGLTILDTPGHAPFHLSFSYRNRLFCGEAAGVFIPLEDGYHLRPPTPPRFFFEQTVGSVDQLLALPDQPIYFGHAGCHAHSREIIRNYRNQLHLWKALIAEVLQSDPGASGEKILEVLLQKDPVLANFPKLAPLAQERERFFMRNSIAGFLGYLKDNPRIEKDTPAAPRPGD